MTRPSHDLFDRRRLRLVPFTITFTDATADKRLPLTLQGERQGILAWAVRGCLEWQKSGLGDARAIQAATKEYRQDEDSIGQFLAEKCKIATSKNVAKSSLYECYKSWAMENTEPLLDIKAFGQRVKAHGYMEGQARIAGKMAKVWRDMVLLMYEEPSASQEE